MTAHQQLIPFEPAQLRLPYNEWTAEKQSHFIEALAAPAVGARKADKADTPPPGYLGHRARVRA